MSLEYKNPITGQINSSTQSVAGNSVFGVTFSVSNVGGHMEVWSLADLELILTGKLKNINFKMQKNDPFNVTMEATCE